MTISGLQHYFSYTLCTVPCPAGGSETLVSRTSLAHLRATKPTQFDFEFQRRDATGKYRRRGYWYIVYTETSMDIDRPRTVSVCRRLC